MSLIITMLRIAAILAVFPIGFATGWTLKHPAAAATDELKPAVIRASVLFTALQPAIPGLRARTIAETATSGAYAGEFTQVQLHRHLHSNEYVYVISGLATVHIGTVKATVRPGDFFVIPKGAPHSIAASSSVARMLWFEEPPVADNDIHYIK